MNDKGRHYHSYEMGAGPPEDLAATRRSATGGIETQIACHNFRASDIARCGTGSRACLIFERDSKY